MIRVALKKYRYQLDESSKKFRCPSCGKKRFVRFVDTSSGEYLPRKYGRCDRDQHCRYHYSPYDDNYANKHVNKDNAWRRPVKQAPPKPPKFIPRKLFKKSIAGYKNNSFVGFLLSIFEKKMAAQLIKKYGIGTSAQIKGGCIFYQIDATGKIRRGKIMVYDSGGHRKAFHTVHAQLGWSDRLPKWRFFGEHLLNESDKPVAIVESEKTAIISSIYFPQYIWLATGSKSTLKKEYAKSLSERYVVLFPDIGAFSDWQNNDLAGICNVSASDYLETHADAEAKKEGYDLADYLIQFDSDKFLARVINHARKGERRLEAKYESRKNAISSINLNNAGYPKDWEEISLSVGSTQYTEATRAALKDCDTDFEKLQIKDSKVTLLKSLFDAQPSNSNAIELT
jgi:DNA-directed RNA polymerase subunit RPC12/RpoP